jgi:threonine dehydrogenase-like Zn-dependent dehydrogenase
MKQVTHTQRDGAILVRDVPPPTLRAGGLLVRTGYSAISAGTERTKVEVAKKSLLGKALARPDQVRQVIESAQQIGVAATYQKVTSRMDALSPLGYSSAGVVLRVAADTRGFMPGDRVACGGATATHSEIVAVPQNLCALVPDGVGLDEAAFATIGSIALHGVRQSEAALGETVGVIGLGVLGLITVQLLRCAGCRVVGVDIDAGRCELARQFGADAVFPPDSADAERVTRRISSAGLDAVIVTAATASNEPVELAGRLARDRAIVVIVGAVRIDVPRSPYYEKELEVRLSRSYGP